jgi:hypothetical protein
MTLTQTTAENTLKQMLTDAGLDLALLPLDKAWDVFIAFCQIPIDTRSDGVIVQWGPHKIVARELKVSPYFEYEHVGFYFSVLRQFDDVDDTEYEQLEIKWVFPRDAELDAIKLGNSDWCFAEGFPDKEDMGAFLNAQQDTPLYQALLQRSPLSSRVYQENTG